MKKCFWLLLLVVSSSSVYSQELDPILFTSKQESPGSKMTSSSYVMEQEDIENKGNLRAVDILRQVPGLQVNQTGIVGGVASIHIRGSESRHTVIMIDGIKVYDPTAPDRSLNLSILNTLDIERVEVLKGAQSVLYGSNAIGGVVNIITKKGEGKNRLKAGLGIAKHISGGHTLDFDKGLVYTSAYYQDSEFDSDVDEKSLVDLKINKGVSTTASFQLENFELETTYKLTNDFSETDGADAITGEPMDYQYGYSKTNHHFLKQGVKYSLNDYEKIFYDFSYNDFDRIDNFNGGIVAKASGNVLTNEFRYLRQLEDGSMVVGYSLQNETFENDTTSETKVSMSDFFGNRIYELDKYILEAGARLTTNNDFGSHLVYNTGARYILDEKHSFNTSFKTGFQAPSNYQLFGGSGASKIGNSNLAPEKSKNFEMGYDYQEKTMQGGVAFFQNKVDDLFVTRAGRYANEDDAQVFGMDSYLNWQVDEHNMGTSFAYYNYDLSSGKEVARRAKHVLGAFYNQKYTDAHSFGGNLRYNGERFDYVTDSISNTTKKTLDPYAVIDLNYTFTFEDYKLMAFVKNLLDTEYEVAYGYNSQRRGVQLNFEMIY